MDAKAPKLAPPNMPKRIFATVNGVRFSMPSGTETLIGGWEETRAGRDHAVEFVRADVAAAALAMAEALEAAPRPEANGPDADWYVRYMDWFFKTRLRALALAKGEQ